MRLFKSSKVAPIDPLILAVSGNDLEQAGRLLEEANGHFYRNDKGGDSLLHISVRLGFRDMTDLLLDFYHNLNVANNTGDTPLHVAARFGNKDMVEKLLKEGAKPNVVDSSKRTPLSETDDLGVIELLLSYGANPRYVDYSFFGSPQEELCNAPEAQITYCLFEMIGHIDSNSLAQRQGGRRKVEEFLEQEDLVEDIIEQATSKGCFGSFSLDTAKTLIIRHVIAQNHGELLYGGNTEPGTPREEGEVVDVGQKEVGQRVIQSIIERGPNIMDMACSKGSPSGSEEIRGR